VRAVAAARGSWVTISGSIPPGADLPALIAAAHAAGAQVALDTHGDALRDGLGAGPRLVKVNRAEAEGVADGTPASLRAAAGGDGHAAIVTDGIDGLVAVLPDGSTVAAAGSSAGAYPQGSGDALLAGLVAALDGGARWEAALAAGIGAAEANAEQPGAARLDPDRARALAADRAR
jgi:tagatose 6-phosphate kinase